MREQTAVLLGPLTTLQLGGPAARLLTAESESDLITAAREHPEAMLLGGGSNVVLPDAGLDEVVLVRSRGMDGLRVQAGEDWDGFVQHTLDERLVGLEALSGIPGTVGASPMQNIGAYGAEVASAIRSVRVFDRREGAVVELAAADCGFRYRSSAFKSSSRWIILSVEFALPPGVLSAPVRYPELASMLDVELGERAPAAEVREAVLALRRGKGMVLDPTDPDSVSAGSFFTNPVVAEAPSGAPSWPEPDGRVKVSAAWLIQQAGFERGWGQGRIGLSSKHALALVNRGGGTAAELLEVARTIRDGVRARFGVELCQEPVLVDAIL